MMRKFLSCVMAFVLAVSLCPLPKSAFADDASLAAGQTSVLADGEGEEAAEEVAGEESVGEESAGDAAAAYEAEPADEAEAAQQLTAASAGDSATFTTQAAAPAVISMYRLYNKWSGEHLFTSDEKELKKNVKLGWKNEGTAWYAPATGTAVYRLYNKWSGDHHFTTSLKEYQQCIKYGWTGEGIAFRSGGTTEVHRLYNKYVYCFYHHYTMDVAEKKTCVKNGWKSEGVGWYGYAQIPQATPDPAPTTPTTPTEGITITDPSSPGNSSMQDSGLGDADEIGDVGTASNEYTLKLMCLSTTDGVDGEPEFVDTRTLEIGESVSLHTSMEEDFSQRTHMNIKSWNTSPDGTGTSYSWYATIGCPTQTPGSEVTLYAMTGRIVNTLYFNLPQSAEDPSGLRGLRLQYNSDTPCILPDNDLVMPPTVSSLPLKFYDPDGNLLQTLEATATTEYEADGWQTGMSYEVDYIEKEYENGQTIQEDGSYLDDWVDIYPHFNRTKKPAVFTLPDAPEVAGQTFQGWYTSLSHDDSFVGMPGDTYRVYQPGFMVAYLGELYAKYTPDSSASNKGVGTVLHWKQKLAGSTDKTSANYELDWTDNFMGVIGEDISPATKTYEGFNTPAAQVVTMTESGTHVDYYYDRLTYTVSLAKGTGISSVTGGGTYRYGASVTVSAAVQTGYVFKNWTGTKASSSASFEFTMPASNVLLTANAGTATLKAKSLDRGYYVLTNGLNSNEYLDMSGASTSANGNAQLWQKATDQRAQIWFIAPHPSDSSSYMICNANSAYALEAAGASSGSNVRQNKYSSSSRAQRWKIYEHPTKSGCLLIINANTSSMALAANAAESATTVATLNGKNVQLASRNDSLNSQAWKATSVTSGIPLPALDDATVNGANDGAYGQNGEWFRLYTENAPTTMCVNLAGSSRAVNAQIFLYKKDSNDSSNHNDFWQAVPCESGYYYLRNGASSLVMTVTATASGSGYDVRQDTWGGKYTKGSTLDAQKWKPYRSFYGGVMWMSKVSENATSGLVLDISGGSTDNCANVQVWPRNNTCAQSFRRSDIQADKLCHITLEEGSYQIISGVDMHLNTNNYSLDVNAPTTDAGKQAGANIQIWERNGSTGQKWDLTQEDSGKTTITSRLSNYPLDVEAGLTNDPTNMRQWYGNSSDAQKWYIYPTIYGAAWYEVVSAIQVNGKCTKALDVSGAAVKSGANVQIWTRNHTGAQVWWFNFTGASRYSYTPTASAATTDTAPASGKTAHAMTAEELALSQKIFDAYVKFRQSKGLPTPRESTDCINMAYWSARGCAQIGALQHRLGIPSGVQSNYSDILQYSTWKMEPQEAITRWSQSAGHRKMMQCSTTQVAGVACYNNNGIWYYAIVYNFIGTNQSGT